MELPATRQVKQVLVLDSSDQDLDKIATAVTDHLSAPKITKVVDKQDPSSCQ